MDELSNEQTEKVLQFQAITGIDDMEVLKEILIRHGWDIELAFQERERLTEGVPSLFASNDNRAPAVLNDRFLQQIFISNRNNGISPSSGGIFGIFSAVIHWCYTTFSSFIQTLLSVFSGQERIVTDPLGDVLNFIRDYNIKFPVHPVFYQGTYAQVLNDAKRELKFLLIYLHSATISKHIQSGQERVTETISFCRNTLSNPEVVDYVNKNMLFWACDISSPEGYRVSHSINARTYPLLVIIGLRDNKMTIMGRSEGDCTPQEFLGRLQRVVNDNERYINAARHERLERSLTQTLRAQQDVAYEESLRADREKEKKRQREREEQQQIEKEIQENVEAGERRAKLKEEVRIEIMQQIPSEPAETEADTLNIIFKLPNGMRINRRFLKSDSLIDIQNFLFCHPDAPDAFEITQNFPKRILKCGRYDFENLSGYETVTEVINSIKNHQTLSDAGLQNREILFVNDLDA